MTTELKLHCYSATGNLADARQLYQWLIEDGQGDSAPAPAPTQAEELAAAYPLDAPTEIVDVGEAPVWVPRTILGPELIYSEPVADEPGLFDQGLFDDPTIDQPAPFDDAEGVAEAVAEGPTTVTADPELLAAIARAEAVLAAEPEPTPAPGYVGLQDAELDAEWDAMKAREAEAERAKPKPRYSIFGLVKEPA